MEEVTKEFFKEELKYIKEICKNTKLCDTCIFHDKYERCILEVSPESWDIDTITERAFKK